MGVWNYRKGHVGLRETCRKDILLGRLKQESSSQNNKALDIAVDTVVCNLYNALHLLGAVVHVNLWVMYMKL